MSTPLEGRTSAELPPDAAWQTPAAAVVDAGAALPPEPPSATERLEQSRERLREYFESRRPRARRPEPEGASGEPAWLTKLRSHPLFEGVADAVGSWWTSHPLHTVFAVGETALHQSLGPLARRHPIALAAAAVAVGGLLYRTRLLRRLLKPALFAGLATQIATRMIERIPLESVFEVFSRWRGAPSDAAEAMPASQTMHGMPASMPTDPEVAHYPPVTPAAASAAEPARAARP